MKNFRLRGCPVIATILSCDELKRKNRDGFLQFWEKNVEIVNFCGRGECEDGDEKSHNHGVFSG